ncbi:MAG: hypothetical protein ABC585_07545 [Candidatus Methanosuratincola petrocarbonis]|nr:hypothetical protein [Candidatus Methanosuratincola sp.]
MERGLAAELGVAKEGMGAGGSSIAAMLTLGGAITKGSLLREIEVYYGMLTNASPD